MCVCVGGGGGGGSRQPKTFKLRRLILCFLECANLEMTSSGKAIAKFGPPRNQTNFISFEMFLYQLSKNVLFIEFEPLCQTLWTFMSNVDFFILTINQIWSSHMTQVSNLKKISLI